MVYYVITRVVMFQLRLWQAVCCCCCCCLWIPSRKRGWHIRSGYRSLRHLQNALVPSMSFPLAIVLPSQQYQRTDKDGCAAIQTVHHLYYMHPTDCLFLPWLGATLLAVSCCWRCPGCHRSIEPACVVHSTSCTTSTPAVDV